MDYGYRLWTKGYGFGYSYGSSSCTVIGLGFWECDCKCREGIMRLLGLGKERGREWCVLYAMNASESICVWKGILGRERGGDLKGGERGESGEDGR